MTKSGISQSQAGYIGFAALLSCVPANLIVGALGGTFPTRKVYSHVISSDDFKGGVIVHWQIFKRDASIFSIFVLKWNTRQQII